MSILRIVKWSIKVRSRMVKVVMALKVPEGALERDGVSHAQTPEQERDKLTKAGMCNFLQPSINSLFPSQFEVMNTTSAFQSLYTAATSCTISGLPPRSLESHRHTRSGGIFLWMREEMVGPKVFN